MALFVRVIMMFFWLLVVVVTAKTQNNYGIIPAPVEIQRSGSLLPWKTINVDPDLLESEYLEDLFAGIPGVSFQKGKKSYVDVVVDHSMIAEAYQLNIGPEKIVIRGGSGHAIQHGLTSLAQLIRFSHFPLPEITVKDAPAFPYRGMHLDVGRHFFRVEEIKKFLDYLAYYKYNHFHWHLTEDQGWRIEIKKYPKLQEIAAFRDETLVGHYNDVPHVFDGIKYGGYYTQEEIREVVAYATERNIHVVPEIEMPGHSLAVLAAYPELGCTGGPYKVGTKWGVFEDVYCPTEATFTFLEGVIDEVVQLFPYKYIHIGGDECPKTTWEKSEICQKIMAEQGLANAHELQSYFIRRMEQYINAKGRAIIGWDEILEGGLAPNATVMSWRGIEGGLAAARMGHDVIMTPGSHCYFDHYQSTGDKEPLAIGGYTSLEKVYHWEPVPQELESTHHKHILGGQANVWTEYMKSFKQVEYMAYARGLAMAEALWTTPKDYKDFTERFLKHHEYWKSKGANMANHVFELKPKVVAGLGKPVTIVFDLPQQKKVWHEWLGRSEKGNYFTLTDKGLHHFTLDGNPGLSRPISLHFNPHLATQAKISINPKPSEKYPGQGPGSIVNGLLGNNFTYGGTEWLGFEGRDVDILLEWKQKVDIQNLLCRFFKAEGQWIYLPKSLDVFASTDGKVFEKIKSIQGISTDTRVADVKIQASLKNIRFIKLRIRHHGKIQAGAQGAGHGAWLFLDEIVVE